MRLENKVALISGGARGMGAVEARMFAEEGAKVVIGDVLDEEGKRMSFPKNNFYATRFTFCTPLSVPLVLPSKENGLIAFGYVVPSAMRLLS